MRLLDDPEARTLMGKLGRERVEDELAWEHQAPAYLAVFDELTGRACGLDLALRPDAGQPLGGDEWSVGGAGAARAPRGPSAKGRTMKVVLFCGGPRHADAGRQPVAAQADDADRQPPGAVAHHAVLRALRSHRVHPLPRLRRQRGQGLLPGLPRDRFQRLRPDQGRPARRHAQHRHQRLDDHLHRHRAWTRRSASGCAASGPTSRTTSSSSPTTATSSPTPR